VYTPADHDRQMCDSWGDYNTYFSVAAVKVGDDSLFHRRRSNFSRMLALVVDDVDLESLYSPPSWVLETSPGKIQAGYFLDADDPDCGNEALCSAVVKSMTMRGFIGGDISGNNSVRYVRLPVGTNQKPRTTGHFQHRLTVWNPGVRLSLEDACGAVGMDLDKLRHESISAANKIAEWRPDPDVRSLDGVAEGGRNETMFRYACSMRARNFEFEEAKELVLMRAARCAPPMDQREAMTCLYQAWKKPAGRSAEFEERMNKVQLPAPIIDPGTGELLAAEDNKPMPLFSTVDTLLDNLKPIEWLVENYLEHNALSMLFGPSGAGKSFVVVDIACSVATGRSWHGMPVKQGPVFYIAGEGHNGLARRFAAWQKASGQTLKGAPLFKSRKAIQVLDRESAAEVTAEVEMLIASGLPVPSLIVIDTLARNFGDGDENSTKDGNKFVQHLDEFMRNRWGCHVLVVHHSGHDMDRARGSSSFKGAMDQEMWVKGQMGHIELACTKMKDAEMPAPRNFKIAQVGLGVLDDCGVEITGAYLQPDGNPMEFKVGSKRDGGDILAIDVVKAMWPQWPGVPPMAATLGCSERTLSRIMTQLKSAGLVSQKSKTGPWDLTEKGLGELQMTGYCAIEDAINKRQQ
jgi:hypothetical protein